MSYREIPADKILKFPSTAGFKGWKDFFTKESVSHPAKINLNLLRWILKNYTSERDVVLDPMAGTGSTSILASILGRNVISVEYESAFHRLMVGFHPCDGWQCPECKRRDSESDILFNEIAELKDLLVNPLPEAHEDYMPVDEVKELIGIKERMLRGFPWGYNPPNVPHEVDGNLDLLNRQSSLRPRGLVKCIQGDARELSKLLKESDTIITSPPYGAAQSGGGIAVKGYDGPKHTPTDLIGERSYMPDKFEKKDNIGVLEYGDVDAIVLSPPYEASVKRGDEGPGANGNQRPTYADRLAEPKVYSNDPYNIGNLNSDSYLEAMLQCYHEFYKVLKPMGCMVLVVKNFIRDKRVVRLDLDTIRLAEVIGFKLKDRWYFKLPTKSFWRILYHKKFPNVPEILYEDVLIFGKEAEQ